MANKSLYVGNISYSATRGLAQGRLRGLLPLRRAHHRGPRPSPSSRSPPTRWEAAIDAMNGKSVDGRNLTVNEAKPRENSGGGNGRGGDDRGRQPKQRQRLALVRTGTDTHS